MAQDLRYMLHPWHGIEIGENAPGVLTAFIEIVPKDTVKYEVDKKSGWLKVDRPQLFSNVVPALYGFIPQTLCDVQVGNFCMEKTGRLNIMGDQDPMDILVLEEKNNEGRCHLWKLYRHKPIRRVNHKPVEALFFNLQGHARWH